ncbi:hypothetical protein PHLCEN_2v4787 [Hermanssonia centrifuga]|uniref:Uncharacterized protein n=1 Tax=Hermanssonia centrifuga TaxID=98765 RepID=A0A2R6PJ53_9APHY|nr:hypothetical protein PHLCEN_2v4787 [Hermanssonia centrifuga]
MYLLIAETEGRSDKSDDIVDSSSGDASLWVTDGLADTKDTVEGDDGVRVLTVGTASVRTGEGVGTEGGDKVDGVGVIDQERGVGKDGVGVESSEIGDTSETLDPEVVVISGTDCMSQTQYYHNREEGTARTVSGGL